MDNPLSPVALADLKKLCEAATPPLWRECGHARGGCICHIVWTTSQDYPVAAALTAKDEGFTGGSGTDDTQARTNAAFIAAARDALPKLIAEVEKLRGMLFTLARHVRNTDEIHPAAWAVRAGDLLNEMRERYPDLYDQNVK